jgi:hypothetical protein
MSQVVTPLRARGCIHCLGIHWHATWCASAEGRQLVPVRTAIAANAEACGRECRNTADCGWPECSCPTLAPR